MLDLFMMWALVEVLGIICLPLTITVCHNLPDRGWAFSKAIGLAVLAFLVWFPLMVIHVLPFSQLFIVIVLLLLLITNIVGFVRVRSTLKQLVSRQLPYLLCTELIFLGMVFLLGWLRSYNPAININEMYMDEGFISAIMRSQHFPPNDMWFANYSINYYYYAHYVVALLAKLIGQSPSVAFNTGISMYFGLTAVNLFGVTGNIVSWARQVRPSRTSSVQEVQDEDEEVVISQLDKRKPVSTTGGVLAVTKVGLASEQAVVATPEPALWRSIPYGLLTMVMGLVLGNLAATQDWWKNHTDGAPFDWYTPSRVVDKTINEFPAFSFLLSCFHAHVLALAFTILAIGLAFNLLLEKDGKGIFAFGRGWQLPLNLGVTALVLGGLFTMNGWDYPTYLGIAILCILLQQWLAHRLHLTSELLLNMLIAAIALGVLSYLLYLPFYLTFVSPSQGIGIVQASDRSPINEVFLVYGLFAFIFLSLLIASALKTPLFSWERLGWVARAREDGSTLHLFSSFLPVVVLFVLALGILAFVPNSMTFVAAFTIALVGLGLLLYHIGDRAHAFVLLLGCAAFFLVAACEIVYLRDVFAASLPRMNTVFKFYFQAWALLSIACGAGLFFIVESFRPLARVSLNQRVALRGGLSAWSLVLLVLLLAGAVYPILAPSVRYGITAASTQTRSNSLDGLSYLENSASNPGDYEAIRWLNANIQGSPTIIEAVGDSYSTSSGIAAYTGLPTPMGWTGHEYQWRVIWNTKGDNQAEFNRRGSDIDLIYTSSDPQQVLATMAHYHAQYLYVGSIEHIKYSTVDLQRFGAFMQRVYADNGVMIYKVR